MHLNGLTVLIDREGRPNVSVRPIHMSELELERLTDEALERAQQWAQQWAETTKAPDP